MKYDVSMEKAHLNITLDADLVIRLKELAKQVARTLSNYINHILRDLIIRKKNLFRDTVNRPL